MRIPLHNTQDTDARLNLHLEARALRRDQGFRQTPTSRKNPKTKSKAPTTRVEELSQEVYGR